MQSTVIRTELLADTGSIRSLIEAAFLGAPHSSGTEAAIVDTLRTAGVLTVLLVAVEQDEIIGYVAFSPVTIPGEQGQWFGLGPIAVRKDRQGKGIGRDLVCSGLDRLARMGADGCVVLGDPRYYRRFGFVSDPELRYADVLPEYFQRLSFKGATPKGAVFYHSAFDAD